MTAIISQEECLAMVDSLLDACIKAAVTGLANLLEALSGLEKQLLIYFEVSSLSYNQISDNFGKKISLNTIETNESVKLRIATSLLRLPLVVLPSYSSTYSSMGHNVANIHSSENHNTEHMVDEAIDRCLILCGARVSFTAALNCLQTTSVASNENDIEGKRRAQVTNSTVSNLDRLSLSCLVACFRTIRRILFISPDSNPKDLSTSHIESQRLCNRHTNHSHLHLLPTCTLEQLVLEYINHEETEYMKRMCGMEPRENKFSMQSQDRLLNKNMGSDIQDHNQHNRLLQTIEEFIKKLILVPIKVSSACHEIKIHLPTWAVRDKFCPHLVEVSAQIAWRRIEKNHATTAQDSMSSDTSRVSLLPLYFFSLIDVMVRHGGSNEVASGMFRFWNKHYCRGGEIESINFLFTRTMQHITRPMDCAQLLKSIIRFIIANVELFPSCSNARKSSTNTSLDWKVVENECMPFIITTCLGILLQSDIIREYFIQLLVLSPSPSGDTNEQRIMVRCVVKLLVGWSSISSPSIGISSDEPSTRIDYKVFLQSLGQVVYVWCDNNFVQQTDEKQQYHVTDFILCSMDYLPRGDALFDAEGKIIEMLISGVSVRLSITALSTRKDGMKVGEKLAALLGQVCKFDELDDERENSVYDCGDSKGSPKENMSDLKVNPPMVPWSKGSKPADPDEEVDSQSEYDTYSHTDGLGVSLDEEDSDWDEDKIIPYDLDDDEADLQERRKPRYCRECLEMLRSIGDTYDTRCIIETAMKELPNLVRSNPCDLKYYAETLCKALMQEQNRFDIEQFGEWRFDGLCALTVMEPQRVITSLCEEVFREDTVMDVRLEVLNVLRYSSSELCGEVMLETLRISSTIDRSIGKLSGNARTVSDDAMNKSHGTESLACAAIKDLENATRRWGRGRRFAKKQAVMNKFGSIAPSFFYSLVNSFLQSRENLVLWDSHNGSLLLSCFLSCLTTMIKSSGNHPVTSSLALDLVDLSWRFHDAESSAVRKSVLLAMATCQPHLSHEDLVSTFFERQKFLMKTKGSDCDDDCRRLSSAILKFTSYDIT